MAESLSRIWETVKDYCQERTEIMMIAGVALAALIVIIAIVRYVKHKDDEDDDLEFDEKAFLAEKKAGATSQSQAEPQPKPQPNPQAEPRIETQPTPQPQPQPTPQPQPGPREMEPAAQSPDGELTETKVYHGKIENLLEELAGITGSGLEEVEIKIRGAEVKIKYSGKKLPDGVLPGLAPESTSGADQAKEPAEAADNVENEKITAADISGETAAEEQARRIIEDLIREGEEATASKAQAASEETAGGRRQEGDLKAGGTGGAAAARKFGPDNLDTGRSGKTYTEEELKHQIRD